VVKLNRIVPPGAATVLVKLEFFNPLSSVKDRIGRAMIEAAERDGILTRETQIIEPTSGNTGIALAFVARRQGLQADAHHARVDEPGTSGFAADPGGEPGADSRQGGHEGAIAKAQELAATTPNSWIPQQFDNPANPEIHERTTGPEIWEDTGGQVDIIVAGVGTGGTITGATRYLRSKNRNFLAIAVEAGRFTGDFRRQAGATQDPGDWGRLCAQEPRHEPLVRSGNGFK